MYPKEYTFYKDSIFYDVVARPENHFKAFFRLAQHAESEKFKVFICFPLRTTFIPAYTTLDNKIVNFHILKNKKIEKDKNEIWGQVVDFKKKAFKEQGLNKSLLFEGTLKTNGIGVSIIKQNYTTSRKKKKLLENSPRASKKKRDDDTVYIETLTQAESKSMKGRCVLVDPGRRDILYCMKETSVVNHKEVLVFTKNDRSKRSRHFRILRKSTKPSMVESAEALLSKTSSSTVDVVKFLDYIKTRSSMENVLNQYYRNETKSSKDLYFPGSLFDFRVDEKSNLYFGHLFVLNIRGIIPSPETQTQFQLYHTYLQLMLQQRHISERLDDKVENTVLELAEKMMTDEVDLKPQIGELLEKLQVLPFRKLNFSSKMTKV